MKQELTELGEEGGKKQIYSLRSTRLPLDVVASKPSFHRNTRKGLGVMVKEMRQIVELARQ